MTGRLSRSRSPPHLLGIPDAVLSTAMRDVRVPGRMELVDEGQDFVAVVDYAHSPDAVERVVASVEPADGCRRIVVQAARPLAALNRPGRPTTTS